MKIFKATWLIITSLTLVLCIGLMYSMFFGQHQKCRKITNELLTLKVNSVKIDTTYNSIYYQYTVGYKYKVYFSRNLPNKFEDSGDYLYIRNANGDVVLTYDRKFNRFFGAWTEDYEKILKYLNI